MKIKVRDQFFILGFLLLPLFIYLFIFTERAATQKKKKKKSIFPLNDLLPSLF